MQGKQDPERKENKGLTRQMIPCGVLRIPQARPTRHGHASPAEHGYEGRICQGNNESNEDVPKCLPDPGRHTAVFRHPAEQAAVKPCGAEH